MFEKFRKSPLGSFFYSAVSFLVGFIVAEGFSGLVFDGAPIMTIWERISLGFDHPLAEIVALCIFFFAAYQAALGTMERRKDDRDKSAAEVEGKLHKALEFMLATEEAIRGYLQVDKVHHLISGFQECDHRLDKALSDLLRPQNNPDWYQFDQAVIRCAKDLCRCEDLHDIRLNVATVLNSDLDSAEIESLIGKVIEVHGDSAQGKKANIVNFVKAKKAVSFHVADAFNKVRQLEKTSKEKIKKLGSMQ